MMCGMVCGHDVGHEFEGMMCGHDVWYEFEAMMCGHGVGHDCLNGQQRPYPGRRLDLA